MENDGLWSNTGRTDKPEAKEATIRPSRTVQTSVDKGFLAPDGNYYTNATEYYRSLEGG